VAVKINGAVTVYDDPEDATAYASIVGGELVLIAPPNDGDETILFTREHSPFLPDVGKRISTSLFYDTYATGDHEFGLVNFNDITLDFFDAITFRLCQGQASGRIFSNGSEKVWPESMSNIVTPESLNGLGITWNYGHLLDIQAQLRKVGNIYYFLSGKNAERPKEVLQYPGLNNQPHVTVSSPALHGCFIVRNVGGVRSQLRSGCLAIANESDDDDVQIKANFSSAAPVTNVVAAPTGKLLFAVKVPYNYKGVLNTRDSQFYEVVVSSDKKAKIIFYRLHNQSFLLKLGGYAIEDTDWTVKSGTSLQYIDNSSGLVVSLGSIAQYEFRGSNISANETRVITMPSTRELPEYFTHGEIWAAVGYGDPAAASMEIESLTFGERV